MDNFTDYYEVLGVEPRASTSTIKTAFKKLALQYHPDVYKGEDAQERMRVLLLAYQTLNDPQARKAYDARRSEYLLDASVPARPFSHLVASSKVHAAAGKQEVSPSARRDRQRHYDFPSLDTLNTFNAPDDTSRVEVRLGEIVYRLSPAEASTLKQQGLLRGVSQVPLRGLYTCHRCRHRWKQGVEERVCPACKAEDWREYLLLRCTHCHAVFESEQIRYKIGTYHYGDGALCPPYELFPLCPYCGAAGWCPAEDARVNTLRQQSARRAALLRLLCISAAILVVLALTLILTGVLK
jgi:DnaJ domain